jgi:hypothetical protein
MNTPQFSPAEIVRSQLRVLIANIDQRLSVFATQETSRESKAPLEELLPFWKKMVGLLDLGPEPEVRTCPTCGYFAMRAATRCSYCWTKLLPLEDASSVK